MRMGLAWWDLEGSHPSFRLPSSHCILVGGGAFNKALIPLLRAPPSWPELPKDPPSDIITLGGRSPTCGFFSPKRCFYGNIYVQGLKFTYMLCICGYV